MFGQNNDMQKIHTVTGAIFTIALFILFLGLKLTNNISWSWWWVFAPIWIPWAFGLVMTLLGIKPPQ